MASQESDRITSGSFGAPAYFVVAGNFKSEDIKNIAAALEWFIREAGATEHVKVIGKTEHGHICMRMSYDFRKQHKKQLLVTTAHILLAIPETYVKKSEVAEMLKDFQTQFGDEFANIHDRIDEIEVQLHLKMEQDDFFQSRVVDFMEKVAAETGIDFEFEPLQDFEVEEIEDAVRLRLFDPIQSDLQGLPQASEDRPDLDVMETEIEEIALSDQLGGILQYLPKNQQKRKLQEQAQDENPKKDDWDI